MRHAVDPNTNKIDWLTYGTTRGGENVHKDAYIII